MAFTGETRQNARYERENGTITGFEPHRPILSTVFALEIYPGQSVLQRFCSDVVTVEHASGVQSVENAIDLALCVFDGVSGGFDQQDAT